jgi:hypothetical protein
LLFLTLRAYLELIRIDLYLSRASFASLYNAVRRHQVKNANLHSSTEQICEAVDLASIWYWKRVLCLQRSAAAACLLKANGIEAVMIIGGQQMPFKAHAWVEVDGRVVNDKPYMREVYSVLDRC